MISYAVVLLLGMFLIAFLTMGVTFNSEGYPIWNLIFYLFMASVIYGFSIIPVYITSIRILHQIPKGESKNKYLILFIGTIGLSPLPILIFTAHYLDILTFRIVASILFMTILLWAYLYYFSLGRNLKNEK